MKLSSILYKISRKTGKCSSAINDVETFLTFDPDKILKRLLRKKVNKASYQVVKKINKNIK